MKASDRIVAQLAAPYTIRKPLRRPHGGAVSASVYGAKTSGSSSRWKINRWLSWSHCSRSVVISPRLMDPRYLEWSQVLSLQSAFVHWPTRETMDRTSVRLVMSEPRTIPMSAHTLRDTLPAVGVAALKKGPPRNVETRVASELPGQPVVPTSLTWTVALIAVTAASLGKERKRPPLSWPLSESVLP